MRLTPVAKAERGYFDVERVMRAAARGAACKIDLSDNREFDFWKWAPQPLEAVRRELGIPALEC